MNDVTTSQAYLFMIFILNGIFIGIIFDIFRILRRSFNTPNFITYIEDAIFWIISMLSVMYTLFIFNNGEIRGYIFIGLFFGIALYILFFSKMIVKISVKIIVFFKNVIYSILKIIIYPLRVCLKVICKIINPLINLWTKLVYNMKDYIKKQQNKTNSDPKSCKKLENKEGI